MRVGGNRRLLHQYPSPILMKMVTILKKKRLKCLEGHYSVVLVRQRSDMACSYTNAHKLNFDLMKLVDANIFDIANFL